MNEIKILLDNFQSISSGELTFKTGLNFIIGQSNSGKTATFRALKALLLNPAGSQRFIKRGHSSSTVTMYYNGNEITWKRGQKDSNYTINGESYLKTGKSNVFKILEGETGFVEGDDSAIMNIEEELQLPFPFGYSKSDLFKLYENVFCVSDSAAILKSAKNNEDEIKTEISFIDNELVKNKRKLEELNTFKNEIDLNKLRNDLTFLESNKSKIENLQDGIELIRKLIVLSEINFPQFDLSENKILSYQEKVKINELIDRLKEGHSLSKSMKIIEFTDHTAGLQDLYKTLTEVNKLKLMKTFVLPSVTFKDLSGEYDELISLKKTVTIMKKLDDIQIQALTFEDKLKRYNELVKYLKEIKEIADTGRAKNAMLKEVKAKLQGISEKLKEFKVCPLCHQPINN